MIFLEEEFYHEPHEQGANLESEEINYKYARIRNIEIRGSCPKDRRGLYDKITDKNTLIFHSRLTRLLVVKSYPSRFVLVRVVRGRNSSWTML